MTHERMKIIRRAVDATQARDDERALADFHENVEIHEPAGMPGASVRRGHSGYWEGRVVVEETFREVAYETEELIDAGERVLAAIRYRGRARQSELPVDVLVYWLYAFRHDKVIRVDIFLDRAEALEAAGLTGGLNVDRLRAALAALERDGPEAILELLDPKVEWVADRSDMGRVSYRGVGGVRRSFDQLYEGFDELGFEPDEFHETGNRVVAIGHMFARGRSTGIKTRIPLGIVCTVGADGKLTRYESFRDPNEALEAAGLG